MKTPLAFLFYFSDNNRYSYGPLSLISSYSVIPNSNETLKNSCQASKRESFWTLAESLALGCYEILWGMPDDVPPAYSVSAFRSPAQCRIYAPPLTTEELIMILESEG